MFFPQNSALTKIENGKHLVATYVGRGKDNLDAVDSDLVVVQVVTLFGPFVKYILKILDQATNSGMYV